MKNTIKQQIEDLEEDRNNLYEYADQLTKVIIPQDLIETVNTNENSKINVVCDILKLYQFVIKVMEERKQVQQEAYKKDKEIKKLEALAKSSNLIDDSFDKAENE